MSGQSWANDGAIAGLRCEQERESMDMNEKVKAELAPTGKLRAAINMSNFLLVTGEADNGDPTGVSPDMAAEVARRLGVPVEYVCYPSPGLLGDDADSGNWDIGNIGAEPQRAKKIAFSAAYCEIEATYLVPAGSGIQTIADVDKLGVKIAVTGRAAYGLWLENNIKQAELVKTDSLDSAYDTFVADKLDVLAGLKPRLITDVEKLPGARILDGQFSAVQQAMGTPKMNTEAAKWLAAFVEEAKASGMVAGFIQKHSVNGLSVAPAA
jgi:polar amino acid transport system substrate-binding protein